MAIIVLLSLWACPSFAQVPPAPEWTRLSGRPLLRSQEALKFTYREIDQMNPAEADALSRMLAACQPAFVISKNEMAVYECERAAEYFEIVGVSAGTTMDMLKALRLQWSIWRGLNGPAGQHGEDISRFVEIYSNWKGSLKLRLMRERGLLPKQ